VGYAAALLCSQRWFERRAGLPDRVTRSMIGTSRSDSSLFITYSSTNHRIRSGVSAYAESRMIGTSGNRCLIWQTGRAPGKPSLAA
jgi:hypothetical protein